MQNQQAAQESLLAIAQMSLLDWSLVVIILILLVAFLFLVRYVMINRPGVGSHVRVPHYFALTRSLWQ